jgi:hypothetical protein
MQITQILTLLSALPFLVAANPVAIEESSIFSRSSLERRGGIDFCGSDLRHVGDSCTFGSTKDDPHACGIKDRTVVVSLPSTRLGEGKANNGKVGMQRRQVGY